MNIKLLNFIFLVMAQVMCSFNAQAGIFDKKPGQTAVYDKTKERLERAGLTYPTQEDIDYCKKNSFSWVDSQWAGYVALRQQGTSVQSMTEAKIYEEASKISAAKRAAARLAVQDSTTTQRLQKAGLDGITLEDVAYCEKHSGTWLDSQWAGYVALRQQGTPVRNMTEAKVYEEASKISAAKRAAARLAVQDSTTTQRLQKAGLDGITLEDVAYCEKHSGTWLDSQWAGYVALRQQGTPVRNMTEAKVYEEASKISAAKKK